MSIPTHVKKLAMDAIANKTTLKELKLIEAQGVSVTPLPTPRVAWCPLQFSPAPNQAVSKEDLER